jgi:hypothetical protein
VNRIFPYKGCKQINGNVRKYQKSNKSQVRTKFPMTQGDPHETEERNFRGGKKKIEFGIAEVKKEIRPVDEWGQ